MAATYGVVNMISSFGFAQRWRKQCVQAIDIQPASDVLDLMTGMGELCPDLARKTGPKGKLRALDISPAMCGKAREQSRRMSSVASIEIVEADVLSCPIPDCSIDHIFSSFGLKTFNDEQLETLAGQIYRILRPGGTYSLLEISVPDAWVLKLPYMFYLNRIIPILGRLFMGNPDNYRLLGVYTTQFANCRCLVDKLFAVGLSATYQDYFFGCASGITGSRPG